MSIVAMSTLSRLARLKKLAADSALPIIPIEHLLYAGVFKFILGISKIKG
jgi:hypothetical protein